MKFWRRWAAQRSGVTSPRVEPLAGPSEGTIARERAEKQLEAEIERTAQVRSQTERIMHLGARLDLLRQKNHIREDVIGALLRATGGGS